MNVIAFGYSSQHEDCYRHLVVKHIRSISIRPSSYDADTNKPHHWVVNVDLGTLNHSKQYNNYDEAIVEYNRILNSIIDL